MKPLLGWAALGTALLVLPGVDRASAQTYPTRPITVVVPFTAGGPTDALMRIVGERMRATLGQTLVVENVTGAAGTIGVGRVARANPDGYTLSVGHWSTHVINGAVYPLTFDLLTDLAPIARLTHYPMLLVSKSSLPATDVAGLVSYIKQNQDKVSTGSIGAGSAAHVAGVYFEQLTGLKLNYVPYRGAAPALQDLMSGQIDILFDHVANSLPHVQAGKIRAYAVTDKARLPSAPSIPTFDEAGIPNLHVSIWFGMWAPRGTPDAIVTRLNDAVREALSDPAVRKRLAELGQEIPPPEQLTPAALASYQKAEIDKWWPIVRAANIKPQ
jgi:tripartite-type tricarboxylate transporter receptor subunit TctC